LNHFEAAYFVEDVRKFISNPPPPFEVSASSEELFEGGLEIHTSLDMRLQEAAERIVFAAMDDFDAEKRAQYERRGRTEEFMPVSAALVCLDNRPGYEGLVRAMVGGRDYQQKKFNMATQALRQPGSSIKPFVYLAAIDKGMTPSSIVVDEPFARRAGNGAWWTPRNFSGDFLGPIALQWALDKSVNIVSIKLVERLGMSTVRSYIIDAGFKQPIPDTVSLTLGLGTAETTVLDQAVMYSTLATMGTRHDPVLVTEIRDRDGVTLFDYRDFARKHVNVVPPDSAYVIVRMLEGVATPDHPHYPSGHLTSTLGRPRAGKTGTTNDSRDVWFCGFTPQFTTIVWFGYEDNRSLGSGRDFTGGRRAAPVWTEFMQVAHEGLPTLEFQAPPGIDMFNIDRHSGVAGGRWKAAFKKGTSPRTWSPPPTQPAVLSPADETAALLEQL
ncbi:MAG: penicillin-binding transpeptidase domain-containing protein, partial [Candidatus Hydrogenedentales bacterium]